MLVPIFIFWNFLNADTGTPSTNAPPRNLRPLLSTNSASATFLELHPEIVAPPAAPDPSLTLHPGTSTNAPPEVIPPSEMTRPDGTLPDVPIEATDDLAAHLLVVYNTNDPDSQKLAQYYASLREIPPERVLGLATLTKEEITRTQYDDTIRSPIISYLTQMNWLIRQPQLVRVGNRFMNLLVASHNDIWAIVLIRGIPLKIAPDPSNQESMEPEPALQTNAAAVDSELAMLPLYGLPLGGYVPNIFYEGQLTGIKRIGRQLALNMILVTRLDGPLPSQVLRMMDESFNVEKERLAGLAVIDTRGITDPTQPYIVGDNWLRTARDSLVRDGWDVEFDDKPAVIPATDPCNHVALYLGWYRDGVIGPWNTPPNRFMPGAIAYHLHSFSASTIRSDSKNWVGPLIAHGADATMGMVYEPYLTFTPHEDIFTRRLLQGDYFAEAAYAAQPGLSWMVTVVGDPLYRPFRVPLETALTRSAALQTDHKEWLLVEKVQRDIVAGKIKNTVDSLRQSLEVSGAGSVVEEVLGDLVSKLEEATASVVAEQAYKKASDGATAPVDRIRIGIKLAEFYRARGDEVHAQGELDALRLAYPDESVRFGVSTLQVPTSTNVNNLGVASDIPHPPAPPKPTTVAH